MNSIFLLLLLCCCGGHGCNDVKCGCERNERNRSECGRNDCDRNSGNSYERRDSDRKNCNCDRDNNRSGYDRNDNCGYSSMVPPHWKECSEDSNHECKCDVCEACES